MERTSGFDVLACPRCGGRLRLIALIEEAAVIGLILQHLGVPTEIPAPRPARRSVGVRDPEVCLVARSHARNDVTRADRPSAGVIIGA
jgi:hypothetical protein